MTMYRQILYVLLLLCAVTGMSAQNNPYKIDDGLYAYYLRCQKQLRTPQGLLMADTLFHSATRQKEQKAQCIALYLKVDYYYYADNLPQIKKAVQRLKDFSIKTPYLQYYFGGWNRLVTYYLSRKRFLEAIDESHAYLQDALKLNNDYGIAYGYRHLGNIYSQQNKHQLAMEYYKKSAVRLEESNNLHEAYLVYHNIGQIYLTTGQTDLAEANLKKALTLVPPKDDEGRKIGVYNTLALLYINRKELDKARKILDSVAVISRNFPLRGAAKGNNLMAWSAYYREIGQYELALRLADSISDPALQAGYRTNIYAAMGDYRNAFEYSKQRLNLYVDKNAQVQNELLAEYTSRFENDKLVSEKNRLMLQNTRMQLQRLMDERRLDTIEQARKRMELEASRLSLEQKEKDLVYSRSEALHQQQRAADMEKQNRLRGGIIVTLLCFFTVIGFFTAIYLRQRKHSLRIMQAAKEKAEYDDRMKSVFLQNVSHEIRTPLNAIVGFSDVLNCEDMEFSPEEKANYLELIHLNSDLLTTLVNDVLDLAKFESDSYYLNVAQVNLDLLCRGLLESLKDRVPEGVAFRLEEPDNAADFRFRTDAARLQQVLGNLMTNACKYTEKGSITLAWHQAPDGDGLEFTVTDTGTGIPPEKAEVIFNRFEKLDTFKQGTGLGLNICRAIANLVHGKIYVDTSYRDGARFVFVHPELK